MQSNTLLYALTVAVVGLYVAAGAATYVAYEKYREIEGALSVVKKVSASPKWKWWWK